MAAVNSTPGGIVVTTVPYGTIYEGTREALVGGGHAREAWFPALPKRVNFLPESPESPMVKVQRIRGGRFQVTRWDDERIRRSARLEAFAFAPLANEAEFRAAVGRTMRFALDTVLRMFDVPRGGFRFAPDDETRATAVSAARQLVELVESVPVIEERAPVVQLRAVR